MRARGGGVPAGRPSLAPAGFEQLIEEGVLDLLVRLARPREVVGEARDGLAVELGQLAVIAACFGAVGCLRENPHYRRVVVVPGSAAIAVVGAFWLVERVGLI